MGHQPNVLAALVQRQHLQVEHFEAIERVLAETAFGDHLFQVTVGRAEHPHIVSHLAIALPDGQRLPMRAGDILLLPAGTAHVIHSPGKTVMPIKPHVITGNGLTVHRIGSASPDLDMICGRFHYNRASLLFAALPAYLVIPSNALPGNGPLAALVAIIRTEADGKQAGARFLLDALSQALFTLMLRAHLTTQGQTTGTLALLADKRLGQAWQTILADPAHEWTIDLLAEAARMSRATFMRAFIKVAGVSPGVLLTQIRMELAFSLLSCSYLGLSDIAAQVGYQSQAAFSKKFKEVYGESPGRTRKRI